MIKLASKGVEHRPDRQVDIGVVEGELRVGVEVGGVERPELSVETEEEDEHNQVVQIH